MRGSVARRRFEEVQRRASEAITGSHGSRVNQSIRLHLRPPHIVARVGLQPLGTDRSLHREHLETSR